MSLFQNKYRNETTRLPGFDYSQPGYYFVTICTEGRIHFFGEIVGFQMELSEIGKMAWKCWNEIPDHFPFVMPDAIIVMPNHIHGIIRITEHNEINESNDKNVGTQYFASQHESDGPIAGTQYFASPPIPEGNNESMQYFASPPSEKGNKFGPQSQNLASIIRGYKIGVTKFCRQNNISFAWQPLFYGHIVRNEFDLQRIRKYIQDNPRNWKEDKFFI
jgi:REP element-mobilizing transposase RayT